MNKNITIQSIVNSTCVAEGICLLCGSRLRVVLVLLFELKAMVKKEILERVLENFSRKDIGKDTVGCDQERIRIYTFGGTQIGIAGVGQGEEALTFPAHWDVKDCLDAPPLHLD